MINTVIKNRDKSIRDYNFFMEDTDEPGMATSNQKRTLKDLIVQNIDDSEKQEMCINQIRDISQDEASLWIREMENGLW